MKLQFMLPILCVILFSCRQEDEPERIVHQIASLSEDAVEILQGESKAITIYGLNFGTDASNVEVNISYLELNKLSVSDNKIEVEVPAVAPSGAVAVTIDGLMVQGPYLNVTVIPSISDVDGNIYPITTIGDQTWMAENLRTTHYADGTPIEENQSMSAWAQMEHDVKVYAWYDNFKTKYFEPEGALYTWAAASRGQNSKQSPSGVQGACPDGWHLPSLEEFGQMLEFIYNEKGPFEIDDQGTVFGLSTYLKAEDGWMLEKNGSNDYNFSAYPAGMRLAEDGNFIVNGRTGIWWSSTTENNTAISAGFFCIYVYSNPEENISPSYVDLSNATDGYSVRCVQD